MLKPMHYDLRIEPDLESFTFQGRVTIHLRASEPADHILLDCIGLTVRECTLREGEKRRPCDFHLEPEQENLRIVPPTPVSGRIELKIRYTGPIGDNMAGFYRSAYTAADGRKRHIAVTQFEESDARRALPCMDHPMHKASFDVEMIVPSDLTAISNGAVKAEKPMDSGKKSVRFECTPPMSSYLLFFGVGAFEILRDQKDPRVAGIALPGMAQRLDFGVTFGRKALGFCESYYGIPYPLTKIDLIAIPDFAFGAMENWGAITFRENLLLNDPGGTSALGKQRICEVIAHEIAHQWFGNLVTPSDWKYLWLNESFATYFGFGVVAHYYPEWSTWDQFLQDQTDAAMARDALRDTVPVEIPGGEHVVINTSTAPIIYSKGGSLLRQIEGFIGPENFKQGLRRYLRTHQYACASSHHLWESFEAVSDRPVKEMVEQWVRQPGFPVVDARRENGRLILEQKRFTYLPAATDAIWPIPVVMDLYTADGNIQRKTILMDRRRQAFDLHDDAAACKLNAGQTGFYRVHYDPADLQALGGLVRQKRLQPEDRWGLQNDLFAMVRAGKETLGNYFAFLGYYEEESADLPLTGIDANLFAAGLVLDKDMWPSLAARGRTFSAGILERIGFEPAARESRATAMLRERVLWHAVLYGEEGALRFTSDQFAALTGGAAVHPDLARSVMQAGALQGGEEAFRFLCRRLESTDSEHERMHILLALGGQQDPGLVRETCRYTLDRVPDRNRFIPLVALALNPHAIPLMWDWFTAHVGELEALHPLLYERVIAGIVPLAGMQKAEAVRHFLTGYMSEHPQTADVITLSLEKLEINLAMRRAADNLKPEGKKSGQRR
ncbi:MAG: M1 family metallopeptidase [Deltaproteobacteria bacterium]|nr:M1 family metallopeptidase [Deltaproteobacteria bacterium]